MNQNRHMHPAVDPKDILLHMRSTHFSLLATCFGFRPAASDVAIVIAPELTVRPAWIVVVLSEWPFGAPFVRHSLASLESTRIQPWIVDHIARSAINPRSRLGFDRDAAAHTKRIGSDARQGVVMARRNRNF
jgi:hypothetical protein